MKKKEGNSENVRTRKHQKYQNILSDHKKLIQFKLVKRTQPEHSRKLKSDLNVN